MADPQFSAEHRARFQQLLAIGEVYAHNFQLEHKPFGPWVVVADIRGGEDASERLQNRFQAAARRAALSAGAPGRVGLLDWWICRLAGRRRRSPLESLVQRSIELCEQLECESAEGRLPGPAIGIEAGLRRDHYDLDLLFRDRVYDHPRDPPPDPKAEFDYWYDHVWQGLQKLLLSLDRRKDPKSDMPGPDGLIYDLRRRLPGETRTVFRDRVEKTVSDRYQTIDCVFQSVGYDLAVLLANSIIDRVLRGEIAAQTFDVECVPLIEKLIASWKDASLRLGLSCRKQEREGLNFTKPFRDVATDLRVLLTAGRELGGHPVMSVQSAVPIRVSVPTTGRSERLVQECGNAEKALKDNVSALPFSNDYDAYIAPFLVFASSVYDAEARELLTCGCDDTKARRVLLADKLPTRIIESILPNRSLDASKAESPDFSTGKVVPHEIDPSGIWELDGNGKRIPARRAVQIIYACHGYWEKHAPEHVRYDLREPTANKTMRDVLGQRLERCSIHWLGMASEDGEATEFRSSDIEAVVQFNHASSLKAPVFRHQYPEDFPDAEQLAIEKMAAENSNEKSCLPDDEAKRAATRSTWLDQKLIEKRWTADTEISANGGPSYNTIQRYRSGKQSTRDRYVRLGLSNAFSCEVLAVPE